MPIDRTLLQDIATRGRAALDDYRNRQQMQGSAAQQALQSRSQTFNAMQGQAPQQMPTTGRGPAYDQLIFARNAQRFPQPGSRGIVYGQTPEGKYAGFGVASDLWNAIEGEAGNIRAQDQAEAGQIRQANDARYGELGSDFDAQIAAMYDALSAERKGDQESMAPHLAAPAPSNPKLATPTGRGEALTYNMQDAANPYQNPQGDVTRGSRGFVQGDVMGGGQQPGTYSAYDLAEQMAMRSKDQLGREHEYRGGLNNWLGQQVEPLQEADTYAQDISSTPFSQYAQAAGAEYGVDPNIVAGRFGPAEDYRDYGLQRNLSSIRDYGLPFNEVEAQQKAADSALGDQQKQQNQADEQQALDYITQITGTDAKQLAASANLTTEQLGNAVADPDYQQADADIREAVKNGDDQAVSARLQEVAQRRPDLYEVLVKALQDFVPSGFDLYQQQ